MDADADLAEAVVQKQLLGLLHHAKLVLGNGLAVHEPGRQTGEGRLVPGGQIQFFGQLTNLVLGKLRFSKRALDIQLGDGLETRAVVAVVIHIGAFSHIGDAVLRSQLLDFLKQLMLAQITPVGRILGEAVYVQLLGFTDKMADTFLLTKGLGRLQLSSREGAGLSRHRNGLVAQLVVGHLQ